MDVTDTESRAVGVEAHHVDFAGNVDGSLEPIRLRDEKIHRVAAITGSMDAEAIGVGHIHLDELVGGSRHALHPGLSWIPSLELDRRTDDYVAVSGQDIDGAVVGVIEEILINIEDGGIALALLIV
jgi:hypothetical protein